MARKKKRSAADVAVELLQENPYQKKKAPYIKPSSLARGW